MAWVCVSELRFWGWSFWKQDVIRDKRLVTSHESINRSSNRACTSRTLKQEL